MVSADNLLAVVGHYFSQIAPKMRSSSITTMHDKSEPITSPIATDSNSNPDFLTTTEFAAKTKLSRTTIYRLIARRKLKAIPFCRHKRIPLSEYERWKRGEF